MTTFREYVLGIKLPNPHISWEIKEILATFGASFLIVFGITFSFISPGVLLWSSFWFMLLWIGVPPLVLYIKYCVKKAKGELS